MKTSDFIQSAISHNLKDPHSKALEPDCLSSPLAIMTYSLGERMGVRGISQVIDHGDNRSFMRFDHYSS